MNGVQAIGSLMPSAGNMRGLVERAAKAQPKREIGRGVVMFYAALCATIGNDAMARGTTMAALPDRTPQDRGRTERPAIRQRSHRLRRYSAFPETVS